MSLQHFMYLTFQAKFLRAVRTLLKKCFQLPLIIFLIFFLTFVVSVSSTWPAVGFHKLHTNQFISQQLIIGAFCSSHFYLCLNCKPLISQKNVASRNRSKMREKNSCRGNVWPGINSLCIIWKSMLSSFFFPFLQ